MLRILFSVFFALFTMWANAQIVTVLDKKTGAPMELATVFSENPKTVVSTNALGQADISQFAGATRIDFRFIGYKTASYSYDELSKINFKIYLESAGVSLDKVVVSASRWTQDAREIPSRINTISPSEVALSNPQNAADMLAASGEVFIQKSQQGGGSPMIRGFSTNRLLYSVDGVRMNTAIFRSGNLQNVISLDQFAIENTEIFFGPGSVIYGSDAIGGVMSFQTLSPQLSFDEKILSTGKAVTRYSSINQENTYHFDINLGWKKWAILSSFSSYDFGDLRMGANGPDEYLRPFFVQRIDSTDVVVTNDDPLVQNPTGYSQINMMQKLRFKPNEHWDFQYGFHYSATSDYSRYDRHIRLRNGLPRSGEWAYGPQIWMMNNLAISHVKSTLIYDQMNVRLAKQRFEESRIDRDFNDNERRTRLEEVDAYSLNIDFNKSLRLKHEVFYGIEIVRDEITSSGTDEDIATNIVVPGAPRYPQSDWSSYAAYLTHQYKFSEKVRSQVGVRYNSFELNAAFDTAFYNFEFISAKLKNSALTGSAGVVFNPNEKWSLSANASTGFRSPNVDDMGKIFDPEPGTVIVPNPYLKSEYIYNGEVGVAKVFGSSVKIDFTGYYSVLTDAMVRRDYQFAGQDSLLYDGEMSKVVALQNAASATVYGVQTAIEIKLAQGFGFMTRVNFQTGEEELEDGKVSPLRHAAPFFGVSHLTFQDEKINLDFYVMYNGQKAFADMPQEEIGKDYLYASDANGNPYSPEWYTLNFKASYILNKNFSLFAGMENITDQRYRPYSSGITAGGRNVVISAKASF
jgi:hemoglobin/transferrin/lactoferrin receptor protein